MREYARTRLVELGELEEAERSQAAHYLAYAKTKRGEWSVTPGAQWIEPMVPETDNFRAALAWLLLHDRLGAAEMSATLHRFFDRLALQEEGLRWIERALAADPELPPLLEAPLLDARMTLLINQGQQE